MGEERLSAMDQTENRFYREADDNAAPGNGMAIANPFGAQSTAVAETSGARQSQSRELAEMQTKYLMAQQFPRDQRACMDKILNAFTRPSLAEKAQYQFARGGTDIVGPSIRSAETIAQNWMNMEFGFREISRGVGADGVTFSEVEAFARDLESRTQRPATFIVRHWRDTKSGGYKLKDERDIYELMSNQAQRRVRACILALVPGDVVEAAMDQAEATLKTTADTSAEAMVRMVDAFKPFGVTKELIEKRIQRRLDAIQPAQVVALKRIYASLRDDMSAPWDWFDVEKPETKAESVTLAEVAQRGKKKPQPAAPDPETGEVAPPAQASNVEAKPEAGPSYAALADRIQKAKNGEDADLVLDAARHLPKPMYEDLVRLRESTEYKV